MSIPARGPGGEATLSEGDRSPSFTRGEYWLLEAAVELWMPVGMLDSPGLNIQLNKAAHGLSRADLLDTLERLITRGFVHVRTKTQGEFAPSQAQLEAALEERRWEERTTYYGLTSAGGAAWEAFAAPDWNRRIDSSSDGDSRYEVICADPEWMEKYLRALWREGTLDEATLVYDELVPWAATYWRTLPLGHRARFVFVEDGTRRPAVEASWYCDWYQWR
jgi:hypothetical protein